MIELLAGIFTKIKELEFRDVAILAMLIAILLPVWILLDPVQLERVLEFKLGHNITGSVLSCILTEGNLHGKRSYQIVKVTTNKDGIEHGFYAEQNSPYTNAEQVNLCKEFIELDNQLKIKAPELF